jgi:hypothetical protein
MIAAMPHRASTIAAFLIAAALALVLAFSSQADARAHGAACTHSAAGRSRHGAHPCGTHRLDHKGSRTHPHTTKVGGHRSDHVGRRQHTLGENGQNAGEEEEEEEGELEAVEQEGLCEEGGVCEEEGSETA